MGRGGASIASGWLASLSPEQFFTIRGGMIEAKPMKGTAPRGAIREPTWRDRRRLRRTPSSAPKI